MLVLVPFTLLVAAAAALQSPHRKAASFKHTAKALRKRDVVSGPIEHQYLTEKTRSMSRINFNHMEHEDILTVYF
jgi:carboxypeptidase D